MRMACIQPCFIMKLAQVIGCCSRQTGGCINTLGWARHRVWVGGSKRPLAFCFHVSGVQHLLVHSTQ